MYVHICVYVRTCVYMRISVYIPVYVPVCTCIQVCTYLCIHTYLCVHTCMCTCPQILKRQKSIAEGWEYARLPHMSYHVSDHKLDMARRRRWHRKLVQKEGGKPPVFYFESPVSGTL